MIEEYIQINKFKNSEFNYANWFAAQVSYNITYIILEDCLCIVQQYDGEYQTIFPLGEKHKIKNAILALEEYFRSTLKQPFVMTCVSTQMLTMLEEFGLLQKFDVEERIDLADYIVKTENITAMRGKKLNKIRNDFNHFTKNYKYQFLPISKKNEKLYLDTILALIKERSSDPQKELCHTARAILDREELGLKSGVLYVEGKMSGLVLGQELHGVTLINYARAYTNYRGVYHMMYKSLIEEHFLHLPYVNLMEDMGSKGLKQAKSSFNPEPLIPKYFLRYVC